MENLKKKKEKKLKSHFELIVNTSLGINNRVFKFIDIRKAYLKRNELLRK